MPTIDLSGLDRLKVRFQNLVNPDATPLMVTWMGIIDRDNRQGVMAGLDKDGAPMAPVTYRPVSHPLKPTRTQKNSPGKGARRGGFAGLGSHPAGANNNLTSAEYRRLAGPPLAPRGQFSRVITNLRLRFGRLSALAWEAVGYWDEVVSAKGKKFLHFHFDGAGGGGRKKNVTLPRRDLRGIRPTGVARMRSSLRAWAIDMIRSSGQP